MYISNEVANKIKLLAKEQDISIKKLLTDIGLGFNTMSHMKTSMPRADTLAKIADYLNCSMDYLMGRTSQNTINSSNIAIGNSNIQATGNITYNPTIPPEVDELLKLYKKLERPEQLRLIAELYEKTKN